MDFLKRLGAAIDQDYIPWKTLIITFSVAEYALESYLTYRQYQILRSQQIPAQLKNEIDQKTHDKSQAYGRAKAKFGVVSATFNQIKNIALISYNFYPSWWAVSGLLISKYAPLRFSGEITRSLVFVFSYSFLDTLVGLPFSYWHHFVLEEKFGFNKQTVGLWLTDLVKGQALSLAFGIPIGAAFFRIIQATGDKVSLLFSFEAEVGLMLEDACCWLLLRRFSTGLSMRLTVLLLHLGFYVRGPTPRCDDIPDLHRPPFQHTQTSRGRLSQRT